MNFPLISLQDWQLYKYHGCYRSIIKVNYCCANKGDSHNKCGSNALGTYFPTPWITNGNRTDRGTQFVDMLWTEVCRLVKITRRLSTAFHPKTDGATERANQELETYLRIFISFQQEDWAFQLPIAMMALNSRVSQSTGLSPFFMTHGYHQLIMDFTMPEEQGSSLSLAEQGRQLLERWRNSADMAMAVAQKA